MLKKYLLLVFCIGIHIQSYTMFQKTVTAFMVKSQTLSEAIAFLKKHGFTVLDYKNEAIAQQHRITDFGVEVTNIMIETKTTGYFKLFIKQRHVVTEEEKYEYSKSQTLSNLSADRLLKFLKENTPSEPEK